MIDRMRIRSGIYCTRPRKQRKAVHDREEKGGENFFNLSAVACDMMNSAILAGLNVSPCFSSS